MAGMLCLPACTTNNPVAGAAAPEAMGAEKKGAHRQQRMRCVHAPGSDDVRAQASSARQIRLAHFSKFRIRCPTVAPSFIRFIHSIPRMPALALPRCSPPCSLPPPPAARLCAVCRSTGRDEGAGSAAQSVGLRSRSPRPAAALGAAPAAAVAAAAAPARPRPPPPPSPSAAAPPPAACAAGPP